MWGIVVIGYRVFGRLRMKVVFCFGIGVVMFRLLLKFCVIFCEIISFSFSFCGLLVVKGMNSLFVMFGERLGLLLLMFSWICVFGCRCRVMWGVGVLISVFCVFCSRFISICFSCMVLVIICRLGGSMGRFSVMFCVFLWVVVNSSVVFSVGVRFIGMICLVVLWVKLCNCWVMCVMCFVMCMMVDRFLVILGDWLGGSSVLLVLVSRWMVVKGWFILCVMFVVIWFRVVSLLVCIMFVCN